MGSKPWRDADKLRELYHGQDMSSREVADELGCGKKTILRWLDNHDIPKDPQAKSVDDKRLYDSDWLAEQYVRKQKSSRDIASELGCGKKAVLRWLDKFSIERRDTSEATQLGMRRGHAGFHTNANGYEIAACRDPDRARQVEIHRLVMIAKGEDPHEVFSGHDNHVHHKNEIPWDNRPSNLELLTASEHRLAHS